MESIYHPVSGEQGFFCSLKEKVIIDAILIDSSSQLILENKTSSANARGVEL